MKRVVLVSLIVGVGLVFMWTKGVSAQQKLAPYPIGFCVDLTGRMSEMGAANKRGMEIALNAINGAGGVNGRPLEVVAADGETEPSRSVIHSKRLIDVNKVVVLTGYGQSGSAMAASFALPQARASRRSCARPLPLRPSLSSPPLLMSDWPN